MAHYHIRLRDAGGSWASTQLPPVKSPTIKPPRAAPAKPPAVPKTPGPPKPKPSPQRQTGAQPSALAGIGKVAGVGTRLARAGERGVNRIAEIGEEVNRDSGGAMMGHYHFNIPSRGSKLHDKRRMRDVDTGGGMSSTGGGMSSTAGGMSSTMGGMSSTGGGMSSTSGMGMDAGTSAGAKKAAMTRARGGSARSGQFVTNPGYAKRNQGAPERAAARRAANRDPNSWRGPPSASSDSGTSEGAKKAAQARSRGGGFQPRTAGGFGGAAAAKSHPEGFVQGVGPAQSKPKPAPEPFRGYDKKSWW